MQFHLESGSRVPIYRQVADQIRAAVAKGQLVPGERLPSVRAVSRQLVVNPNTIARSYTELERDGVLVARQGLGVFVAEPRAELTERARRERLDRMVNDLLTEAVHLGFSADQVCQIVREQTRQYQWQGTTAEKP